MIRLMKTFIYSLLKQDCIHAASANKCRDEFTEKILSFSPEHRVEIEGVIDGVKIINDIYVTAYALGVGVQRTIYSRCP